MNIYKTAKIVLVILLFGIPLLVQAAALRVVLPDGPLYAGDVFPVRVYLDAEKPVNAVRMDLLYSGDSVEVQAVDSAGSIVQLWTSPLAHSPYLSVVSAAGGLPNPGFSGSGGLVGTVVAKAVSAGTAEFAFNTSSAVYLNDGAGTRISPGLVPAKAVILPAPSQYAPKQYASTQDSTPPEPFIISISRNPEMFGGKYFASFQALDKDSGISYYQMQELDGNSRPGTGQPGAWKLVSSPVVLQHQQGTVTVLVKAVDRAGNERIASQVFAFPDNRRFGWLAVALLLLAVIFAILTVKKRHARKHKTHH